MNFLKRCFKLFGLLLSPIWWLIKSIDRRVLLLLHKLSSAVYRRTGVDNYRIGILVFLAAITVSCFIAYRTFQIAAAEPNPRIALMRQQGALLGLVIMGGIAGFALSFGKFIREIMQRRYDLEKTDAISGGFAIFYRWFFAVAYLVSIPTMLYWWSMLDTLFVSIGVMFWSCPPPAMEERMKRTFALTK